MNPETNGRYERRGPLEALVHSPGGQRMYPAEAVTVLKVIKAAQRLGFTLDEVAELLQAGRHQHVGASNADLQSRASAKLVEVDAKIAELNVMGAALVEALNAGCDDLIACASSECCPLPFGELAKGISAAAGSERR